MALPDNPFTRYMTAKHGSGIAARADASGNHALSSQVADGYAKLGQAVPPELAGALQELNSITQNEAMLAQAGAAARGVMAAGSYDPIKTRNRAAALEQQIMQGSAVAMQAGAAAELKIQQEKARGLQLSNDLATQTFASQRDATISQNLLAIEQNKTQLATLEDGQLVAAAKAQAYETGATLEDLYSVYQGNDPALMQQTFGTSDRRIAHMLLQDMQVESNADVKNRIDGMTAATQYQGMELINSGQYSPEQLVQMLNGGLEIPEGLSPLAIEQAVRESNTIAEAKHAHAQAVATGIQDAKQLEGLAVASLSQAEKLDVMAQSLKAAGWNGTATDLMQAVATGDIAGLSEALLEATNGGTAPVQITTDDGTVLEVSAQALLEGFAQSYEDSQVVVRQQLQTKALENGYARELAETTRVVRATEGLIGASLPFAVSRQVESIIAGASASYQAAARAVTPEERALLENQAMRMMESAREVLVKEAESLGLPPHHLEDIRQGRFSSDQSFSEGLVQALDPGLNEGMAVQAIADMMRSEGVTKAQLQEFAKNPSMDNLGSLGGGVFRKGVTREKIVKSIHGTVIQGLTSSIMASLNSEAFAELPPPIRNSLDAMLDMRDGPLRDKTPVEAYGLIMQSLRMADKTMLENVDGYVAGTLVKTVQAEVQQSDFLEQIFAPGGKVTRAGAAAMTIYLSAGRDVSTSGAKALAFEQLPSAANRFTVDWLTQQERGRQFSSTAGVDAMTRRDVNWLMERAGIVQPYINDPAANAALRKQRAKIGQAIQSVYIDKLMDETKDQTPYVGGLMSLGRGFSRADRPYATVFEGLLASDDAIVQRLREFGENELADLLETKLR